MQDLVPILMLALIPAGISVLLVSLVSKRWLGLMLLLWLCAPAIAMALILTIGSAFSPAQGSTASNAIFAMMLLGMIVLVPWLVACLIGFAIGFALRRRRAPLEPVLEAEAAPDPVLPTPAVTIQPAISSATARPPQRMAAVDAPDPHFSHASPDGSIRIDIEPVEWASSQWVHTPRVVEAEGGRILCDMLGSDWEAQTAFPRERYVWLGLRRYRTPGHLFAEFDLAADRYRIALHSLDTPEEEGVLGDISGRLEVWWERATALAYEGAPMPPPSPKPHPFAAWRMALVILGGAIAAIAGLTWFSIETGYDPPSVPILRPGANMPR